MTRRAGERRILPGFGLTLGITTSFVGLLILLPLAALVARAASSSWADFVSAVAGPRALASYKLTFGAAFLAAIANVIFGSIVAWSLVRYTFPGRRIVDALVDLPFALPTAVSGIALTAVWAKDGWIGSWAEPLGLHVAFTPLGVGLAMTFIGLPFVVRSLQPAIEDLEPELEECAATLGASRWTTIRRVVVPTVLPALITGFALAFARALGEYGSIIFISGNMPLKTEISSLLVVTRLEQYDYAGATGIAVVMLAASFLLLFGINVVQRWAGAR